MPTLYYGTLEATLKLVVVKAARKHSVNCYAMPNQLFPAWVLTIWNRTVILKDAKDTATLLKGARLPNITQQSEVVIQKSPNRFYTFHADKHESKHCKHYQQDTFYRLPNTPISKLVEKRGRIILRAFNTNPLGRKNREQRYLFPSSFLLWYRKAFNRNFIFRKHQGLISTAAELGPGRRAALWHHPTPNTARQKPNLAYVCQRSMHLFFFFTSVMTTYSSE